MFKTAICGYCGRPFGYRQKHSHEKRKYCSHGCFLKNKKDFAVGKEDKRLSRAERRRIERNSRRPLDAQFRLMHRLLKYEFYKDKEENFDFSAFQKELEKEFPKESIRRFIVLVNQTSDKQAEKINSKNHARQKQNQKDAQSS